jgi:hypothetical protein
MNTVKLKKIAGIKVTNKEPKMLGSKLVNTLKSKIQMYIFLQNMNLD